RRSRPRGPWTHPNRVWGGAGARTTYELAGTPARAEPLLRDLAVFWKQKAGDNSSKYAAQLVLLGANLLSQKKATDAEPVLHECLTIRQKLESDVWTTFNTQSLLGK